MNENIQEQISAIAAEQKTEVTVAQYKKIPLQIVWSTSQILVAKLVKLLADQAKELEGPEKKEIVLETIKTFYDTVFTVFDVPFVPNFLEPIIHYRVKQILIVLVSATIDATVRTFKDTGVIN